MTSLSHIKVLDLTSHLSGPYCAMILADHGADVVKIESPNGGDQLRKTPPFQDGESAPFMLWNRNKGLWLWTSRALKIIKQFLK